MAVQREFCIILAVMVVVLVVPSYGCSQNGSGGMRYSVGDTFWAIPPIVDYYSNWSSNHFFKIGDSLVFDFEAGRFNVLQVTKKEYDSCTAYKPLKVFNSGPVNIPLREKGVFYYMCNISNYCSLGQKISIAVNECPCATPSPSPSSPPRASPPPVPPSSSPHIPALPPSPDNSQPPYMCRLQVQLRPQLIMVPLLRVLQTLQH
ncbi:unnamed protein product [Prunus armeniaca]|uniref:Phytocyanin domain-containing protein n=1 Tax=Prunus armeniaca TaxID=36596 RepID=A0A6J5WHS2_PRUAR|nr:unnamed protein product [Prunus armeniaca]